MSALARKQQPQKEYLQQKQTPICMDVLFRLLGLDMGGGLIGLDWFYEPFTKAIMPITWTCLKRRDSPKRLVSVWLPFTPTPKRVPPEEKKNKLHKNRFFGCFPYFKTLAPTNIASSVGFPILRRAPPPKKKKKKVNR